MMLLIGSAPPASAHVSQFTILGIAGHDVPGGTDWDTAQGTITCTAGERYQVTVKMTDPSYAGKGRTTGTCTGEQQSWLVTFTDESGVGDGVCPYTVVGRAHTKTAAGEPHGDATYSFIC